MTTVRILALLALLCCGIHLAAAQTIPQNVPHRRSTQLGDGFGMNIDIPREPRMPWTRAWTPIFDAGVKWVRIGQYENSSEQTSWDWVEQTPGHYAATVDVDEAIRSLTDNGVAVEVELQYSNPLYQGDPGSRPKRVILPPPGIGQNNEPVNPIFLPPKTDEQIEAFLKYARFMVSRYKSTIKYWEFWNEPNIGYWRPQTHTNEELIDKARWYGRVLSRVADVIHSTDPQAKVIFGGLAGPDLVFSLAALSECASKIDIFAYHTYPGFGDNHMPEEADTVLHAAVFRERIMHAPGVRNDLAFWLNEWNVSPKWKDSNQSVQARYVPRFYLYTHAQRMRAFMWTFIPSTDGNEDDLYGVINGDTRGPDAFQPREALRAFEVTNALFGQTEPDPASDLHWIRVPPRYLHGELQSYAFHDRASGRPIYAFWLAEYCDPADHFVPVPAQLTLNDPSIQKPILIDLRTGRVSALPWKDQASRSVEVPLKDSAMAIADARYLDWPETPETPSALKAAVSGGQVRLQWKNPAGAARLELQRSRDFGPWEPASELAPTKSEFSAPLPRGAHITWRVRAWSDKTASPWSNPAWVEGAR